VRRFNGSEMSTFKPELKKYELPPLPYNYDALEPYISKDIMDLHYNVHHKGYVNGANAAIDKIEKIFKGEVKDHDWAGVVRNFVFNSNGARLHNVFWQNLGSPGSKGGGKPGGKLGDLIDKQFGGFDKFKQVYTDVMRSLTGSGWTIMYYEKDLGRLVFTTVENHFINHIVDLPIVILLDQWEHAYYLQYKTNRNAYIDAWWNVVNWDDAEKRLQKHL
jgi:Fe-Mn family superoxide dismutase